MLNKRFLFFGIILVLLISYFVFSGCVAERYFGNKDCELIADSVVLYKEKEYGPFCKDAYEVFVPECTDYETVAYKAVLCPGDLECGNGKCKEVE